MLVFSGAAGGPWAWIHRAIHPYQVTPGKVCQLLQDAHMYHNLNIRKEVMVKPRAHHLTMLLLYPDLASSLATACPGGGPLASMIVICLCILLHRYGLLPLLMHHTVVMFNTTKKLSPTACPVTALQNNRHSHFAMVCVTCSCRHRRGWSSDSFSWCLPLPCTGTCCQGLLPAQLCMTQSLTSLTSCC